MRATDQKILIAAGHDEARTIKELIHHEYCCDSIHKLELIPEAITSQQIALVIINIQDPIRPSIT